MYNDNQSSMTLEQAMALYPECLEFEKTGVTGESTLRAAAHERNNRVHAVDLMMVCKDVYQVLATEYMRDKHRCLHCGLRCALTGVSTVDSPFCDETCAQAFHKMFGHPNRVK